jgi:L-2,4-diaminobutyrate decarboxylase
MLNCEDNLADARARIARAYDPELLQRAGYKLADALARHLRGVQTMRGNVLNWADPPALVELATRALDAQHRAIASTNGASPEADAERFLALVEQSLHYGINLHDPRYVGHQVPASVPIAGLFDAVGSVTNNPMAIYEMGPWATAVECALVNKLAGLLGWPADRCAGIVTHGASLANLTALLVARNVALARSWEEGLASGSALNQPGTPPGPSPKLIVQADAHYCISRAAGMLGIGTTHVVKAALDERRRMDPRQLEATITAVRRAGNPIVAVVACACATPVGAFDPLEAVADVCERHGVWLHVDGAHGAAALFSDRYRRLVAGIERADSLTWDAHKMLFVPALCAFLFFKQKRHSFEAFKQNAPYLFDPSAPGMAEFDSGLRTVECTKRAAALGLWGVWCLFGPGLFADMLETTFDLGRKLYERLMRSDDFEPLHEPECNIVVFRHIPPQLRGAAPERLGAFQWRLRRAIIESGEWYLVPATHNGVGALRCTLINPLTTEAHLDALLEALRRHGAALL